MQTGMLVGAASFVIAVVAWKLLQSANRTQRNFIGAGALAVIVAGSAVKVVIDKNAGPTVPAGVLPQWQDIAVAASSLSVVETESAQGSMQVASVPSLLSGLEQRLQSNPDDAKGWALLAQSYAFVGQPELADQAVAHAVSLGLDESDLRQRVAGAARKPHASGIPGIVSE
jgi:cytochrome c-type biogenesis protein CcmH/NrfG